MVPFGTLEESDLEIFDRLTFKTNKYIPFSYLKHLKHDLSKFWSEYLQDIPTSVISLPLDGMGLMNRFIAQTLGQIQVQAQNRDIRVFRTRSRLVWDIGSKPTVGFSEKMNFEILFAYSFDEDILFSHFCGTEKCL